MRSWARFCSCAAALSIFYSTACRAGAFLQRPGEGIVILSTSFADAHKAYDARGKLVAASSYAKFETQAYVEYGLIDEITMVAESSYMRFRGSGEQRQLEQLQYLTAEAIAGAPLYLPPGLGGGARYEGLGAGWIGARLRLLEWGATIVSVQGSLRAATPAAQTYLDMKRRLQEDARLQLGWPIEIFGLSGFSDMQLGYRSSGQSGDELRGEMTFGLRPVDGVLLLAQSFIAFSPWNGSAPFMSSQKAQLSAVCDVTKEIAVQLGVRAALRGVNESAERGLLGALWYRF
jgi:protein XagA